METNNSGAADRSISTCHAIRQASTALASYLRRKESQIDQRMHAVSRRLTTQQLVQAEGNIYYVYSAGLHGDVRTSVTAAAYKQSYRLNIVLIYIDY